MQLLEDHQKRDEGIRPSLSGELNLSSIRLLLVEDDEADFLHLASMVKECQLGSFSIEWAQTYDMGKECLREGKHDVCLLDYRLGGRHGVDLLKEIGDKANVPVIMLTGAGSYEIDAAAMKAGAADYFDKQEVTPSMLERSMRYAIRNHQLRCELKIMAHQDDLTGLDNPRMFRSKIEDAIARARRAETGLVLLFLDLDGFKAVNDTLGHTMGDTLLKEVARRLRSAVRESDLVARSDGTQRSREVGRLGGDEFAVLLEGVTGKPYVESVAGKLINAVSQIPYHMEDDQVSIGASVGVACYPQDADTVKALIECADSAMYAAKDCAESTHKFYEEDMQTRTGGWPNE